MCNCRNRARERGIPFTLTRADIVIPDRCPIFGTSFRNPRARGHFASSYAPSIDRVNNKRGYTRTNIVVVSCRANSIKGDATARELHQVARFYTALERARR